MYFLRDGYIRVCLQAADEIMAPLCCSLQVSTQEILVLFLPIPQNNHTKRTGGKNLRMGKPFCSGAKIRNGYPGTGAVVCQHMM